MDINSQSDCTGKCHVVKGANSYIPKAPQTGHHEEQVHKPSLDRLIYTIDPVKEIVLSQQIAMG